MIVRINQRFRWELALEALKDVDRPIPVLVELRYDWSIVQAICAEFRQAKLKVSAEEVDDLLLDDKLLLLLDGVNEMPSQQRRQEFQLFRGENSDTPMIFTTRDLALGGSLGIEKQLEMCALTQPQMREFVHKHLPQHGDLLLRQLRDRLREIAETPLLLKMMCEVFENTGEIPQSKGELFQKFDRRYDEIKGITPVSDDFRRFKSELLQQLAFVMLQGDLQQPTEGLVAIFRDRAEGILECWLRDEGVLDAPTKAKEWLEDLLEHHLLQVAAKPEEIEFHHQLFQEYYAGRALLKLLVEKHQDAIDDERLQHFYLNYFKWTEPLAFMLSLLGDEVQAVRVVRLALEVDVMLGARLAGEVQREFQKRAVGLVDGLDVPWWLKVGLLAEVRSDEAIPGLLKLLEDSDSDVRSNVSDTLGKIGSEAGIPRLLKLIEHSEYSVRKSATNMLVKIVKQHTEAVAPHLPHLLTLIPSKSGEEVHRLILAIQAACKYYNYPIRQLSLTPESRSHPANPSASVYIQSIEEFKLMSKQPPIFNQQNATIGVNYAAENSNPKVIQKIEAAQQSSPEDALNAVVQIIQALEKKHTEVQDEQQARNIINVKFKEIKEQKSIEWQNLISVKRLYNGGKKAAVKVGEHFTESNPLGQRTSCLHRRRIRRRELAIGITHGGSETGFLRRYFVRTRRFDKKPGFFGGVRKSCQSLIQKQRRTRQCRFPTPK